MMCKDYFTVEFFLGHAINELKNNKEKGYQNWDDETVVFNSLVDWLTGQLSYELGELTPILIEMVRNGEF